MFKRRSLWPRSKRAVGAPRAAAAEAAPGKARQPALSDVGDVATPMDAAEDVAGPPEDELLLHRSSPGASSASESEPSPGFGPTSLLHHPRSEPNPTPSPSASPDQLVLLRPHPPQQQQVAPFPHWEDDLLRRCLSGDDAGAHGCLASRAQACASPAQAADAGAAGLRVARRVLARAVRSSSSEALLTTGDMLLGLAEFLSRFVAARAEEGGEEEEDAENSGDGNAGRDGGVSEIMEQVATLAMTFIDRGESLLLQDDGVSSSSSSSSSSLPSSPGPGAGSSPPARVTASVGTSTPTSSPARRDAATSPPARVPLRDAATSTASTAADAALPRPPARAAHPTAVAAPAPAPPSVQSALAAAVQEISALRVQLLESKRAAAQGCAKLAASHALAVAKWKTKIADEVRSDRAAGERAAQHTLRQALGEAELRHHAALTKMRMAMRAQIKQVKEEMLLRDRRRRAQAEAAAAQGGDTRRPCAAVGCQTETVVRRAVAVPARPLPVFVGSPSDAKEADAGAGDEGTGGILRTPRANSAPARFSIRVKQNTSGEVVMRRVTTGRRGRRR